jgi:hypothetical protein
VGACILQRKDLTPKDIKMENTITEGQSRPMPPHYSKIKIKLEALKAELDKPLATYATAHSDAQDIESTTPAEAKAAYEAAELAAYYANAAYNAYSTAHAAYNTAIQNEQMKRKENK